MSALTAEHRELMQYQLRLPGFEGPFDVLLRLVERQQLPIAEVSLVSVTDQFLDHLSEMEFAPPAMVVEFAAVGSRLVQLKARSLLPQVAPDDDDSDDEDLVVQLLEYKAVKDAAARLGLLDLRGERSFQIGEQAIGQVSRSEGVKLAAHQPGDLVRALRRRLTVVPRPTQLVPMPRPVSLKAMVNRVLDRVRSGPARFDVIAASCASPQEVRTAFLGMLILVRRGVIEANQTEPFGQIDLVANPAATTFAYVDSLGEFEE